MRDWSEVERLAPLPKLEEVLLAGNPLYNEFKDKQAIPDYRIEVKLFNGSWCLSNNIDMTGEGCMITIHCHY